MIVPIAAIVAFVVAVGFYLWAFPDESWYLEDSDYIESPLWRTRR